VLADVQAYDPVAGKLARGMVNLTTQLIKERLYQQCERISVFTHEGVFPHLCFANPIVFYYHPWFLVIIVGNVARIVFIRSKNSALHPACSSQHAIFTSTGFA
jgi:hypothetical protein